MINEIFSNKPYVENPFNLDGLLKSNVIYKTGEYDYFYETDELGRIVTCYFRELCLTTRNKRLRHNADSPDKIKGVDHAGHLAGDKFGGSPELDNIVSQYSLVNLSTYRKLESEWIKNIKENKTVTVCIYISYVHNSLRPSAFNIEYSIDGNKFKQVISNCDGGICND